MKQTANLKKRLFMRSPLMKPFLIVAVVLLQLLMAPGTVFAQNKTVKGQVLNESGQPVQRPSVLVKGTTTGVTGDDNGNFSISAPSNGVLVISAVDFTAQEVKINGRTSLTVSLVSLN